MKTQRPTLISLQDQIAALEARLTALELSATTTAAAKAADEIPWAVLTAAIAAVIPHEFLIRSVSIALPEPRINWWGLEGRSGIMNTRRVR